ncbi:type IV toxin-antitoxin system AbiEi family antitoxin domain-containing protein [Homoserinibacter sp. GY 40078]|uniref:type IV toxin-antitoxin system AbiEi family antitoxin domain-containing protein n=1 Tax=Homoserinibacter sp. GY 40078 TaxID=2603275 RepID=UPI0011CAAEE4|nr:type IV toxin-antitoxin system AbiEi family antitoxin domain-containing protein [Homoserinibacter sp. GY 40078]TXK19218.1 hypothetical protein FVQ89_04710 [Homoserinibacter sp. GY 40078]
MDTYIPPLIFTSDIVAAGEDARAFRRAARAGHYLRLRRGVYCARPDWDLADGRGRHIARVRAVVSQLRPDSRALVAGYSAAAIHGFEVLRRFPDDVTLLTPFRGGGTAEPGVIRTSARWRDDHGATVEDLPVTSEPRTLFDIVLRDGFVGGVASLDSALRRGTTDSAELAEFLERWRPATGMTRCVVALAHARPASGSFGESACRATIVTLGFPEPALQAEFVDAAGRMYADFFWPEYRIAGEFDGKIKYTREEFTRGDPSEVVWREKLREDRLRRKVRTVVRFTWDDVRDPRALAALLESAGLPRHRHVSGRVDTAPRVSFGA